MMPQRIFVVLQIIILSYFFQQVLCQSDESSSPLDTEEVENESTDSSTPPVAEEEKVLTEAESVADLTEPLSSTPSLMTEESVVVKTSTLTTPLKVATELTKESAPASTIAVWDDDGKICILAKFSALFTISYLSDGTEQDVKVDLPPFAKAKGKCDSENESPLLQLLWEGFVFTMSFSKTDDKEEDKWFVSSMDLRYDTALPLFDRASSAGKKTARSKPIQMFETSVGKSHSCPSPEVVLLYTANKQVGNVRLGNVHLQPYDVKDGKLSKAERCGQVSIDSADEEFVQDETIPLAVGCTLGLLTLLILVAFSIHRAYMASKVDYSNMEE